MTGTLRPDAAIRTALGRWLRAQTLVISTAWIGRVRARPFVIGQGKPLPQAAEDALEQIYGALVTAMEVGRYEDLDQAAARLTKIYLPLDYPLSELQGFLAFLKDEIWQAATDTQDAAEALPQVRALDLVMTHLQTQVSLSYLGQIERSIREELDQTRWRLEKLDRTKSTFISIAAHELKTPLTLIQGYVDILNMELGKGLGHQYAAPLSGIASGAQRLSTIIQDMIAVSMIDNEVLALRYQPTILPTIINMAIRDLEEVATDRNLKIVVDHLDIPSFFADPPRLYQVFSHVIGNGIKYTPDGGAITISSKILAPGSDPAQRFVQVSIADTGIGIAPEEQERIFDKFYGVTEPMRHSSGRTKFKGGGPGLGLAVAKGIIDAHGGKIWVESPGCDEANCPGSTFHIVLPLLKEPPSQRGQQRLGMDAHSS